MDAGAVHVLSAGGRSADCERKHSDRARGPRRGRSDPAPNSRRCPTVRALSKAIRRKPSGDVRAQVETTIRSIRLDPVGASAITSDIGGQLGLREQSTPSTTLERSTVINGFQHGGKFHRGRGACIGAVQAARRGRPRNFRVLIPGIARRMASSRRQRRCSPALKRSRKHGGFHALSAPSLGAVAYMRWHQQDAPVAGPQRPHTYRGHCAAGTQKARCPQSDHPSRPLGDPNC